MSPDRAVGRKLRKSVRRPRTPALLTVVASAALFLPASPIPLKDVDVRGAVHPVSREVKGIVATAVHIPFGQLRVKGRARASYGCDATFSGTISYGGLVRFFARLKDVSLVTVLDGSIESPEAWSCDVPADSLRGHFSLRDSVLTGHLHFGGDSITMSGPIWTHGDTTFHSILGTTRRGSTYTVRINFYKR